MRDLRAQIAAGNVRIVPAEAQKCLAALATCNGPTSLDTGECRDVFEGNVPLGAACQRSEDCAGDAYCNTGGMCPGTCEARGGENDPCNDRDSCSFANGLASCNTEAAAPACHKLTIESVGLGEACTQRLLDATELLYCEEGLWCGAAPGGTTADPLGQCREPIPTNGECLDFDDVCAEGFCDTNAGKCGAVMLLDTVGAACDRATYAVCDPILGLHSSADAKCEKSGDGSEGSLCFTGDWQRPCNVGLYCQRPEQAPPSTGTCQPALAVGKSCESSGECASGVCDTTCQERYCAY
jgi:hypothetical protein